MYIYIYIYIYINIYIYTCIYIINSIQERKCAAMAKSLAADKYIYILICILIYILIYLYIYRLICSYLLLLYRKENVPQ